MVAGIAKCHQQTWVQSEGGAKLLSSGGGGVKKLF